MQSLIMNEDEKWSTDWIDWTTFLFHFILFTTAKEHTHKYKSVLNKCDTLASNAIKANSTYENQIKTRIQLTNDVIF